MEKNWKYVTLNLAGEIHNYIVDMDRKCCYLKDFPGVELHPYTLQCGHRLSPQDVYEICLEKIGLQELQKANSIQSREYDELF